MLTPSPALIAWFASQPQNAWLVATQGAHGLSGPLRLEFDRVLKSWTATQVQGAIDEHFFIRAAPAHRRTQLAREALTGLEIEAMLLQQRLHSLRHPTNPATPAALGLAPDEEGLVPLSEFEPVYGTFLRRNTHFFLYPTLQSQNSSYWLALALGRIRPRQCSIRLDPHQHVDEGGPLPMYKMWVYGVPLDWARVLTLREDEHLQWMSDPPGPQRVTDIVWRPRGNELHFLCEEVPTSDEASVRPGRYFHSIIDRTTGMVIHADGAVRLYDSESHAARTTTHVRSAGKAGFRAKIFRVDEPIDRQAWAELVAAFFVWNDDVQAYFRPAPIHI